MARVGLRRRAVMGCRLAAVILVAAMSTLGCAGAAPAGSGASAVATQARAVLLPSWEGYKQAFIQADGRVIDPKRDGATTSEGQSYAMLRALLMDDRQTFERAWRWTEDNLRVESTGLPGYLWGRDPAGAHRRLSDDSAADADVDMALALVEAARRWHVRAYGADAGHLLGDIWARDVVAVAGAPVISAGSWVTGPGASGAVVINPSYLSPYAYRVFAGIDGHPWSAVVDSSYRLLRESIRSPLGGSQPGVLPPNWCAVDRSSGHLVAATQMPHADEYGYDAFRTPWRIAVDVMVSGAAEGRAILASLSVLRQRWHEDGHFVAGYTHDARALAGEDLTVDGGDLGALVVDDPGAADQVVRTRLIGGYHAAARPPSFGDPLNYYEQNWAWFGLALAAGSVTEGLR